MVNLIHEITYGHGKRGWVMENIDASDYNNDLVRTGFNQVVKGILGKDAPLMLSLWVLMRINIAESGRT
jgi:hypothetical protein